MIHGKLWGVTGASYWYLLAYGAPAVMLSVLGGVLAFFWTLLWLGVTVLAMYFVGAAGLYCSARGHVVVAESAGDAWHGLRRAGRLFFW